MEQLQLTDATRLAESALATMSLGHSMRSTFPAWILGVVALAQRDLDTATDQFRAGVDGDAAEAAPRHQANSCWGLACVSNTAGRIPKAARLHREALALRDSIGDRLGVAESLIGTAAVVASADRVVAGALIAAAQRLRTQLGAVVTPRQTDDVAAASAMLGEHETSPADSRTYDEATAVARAVRALEEIESLGGRSPAKEKG